jgi:hypothetical protein
MKVHNGFDYIWEMLLSRDAKWILAAYESLEPNQKQIVLEHLQKMVAEPGWQPGQRQSAKAALDVIPRSPD